MLHCLSLKSSSATSLPNSPATINLHGPSPVCEGNSTDGTPRSSSQPSPVINLTREFTLALQTNSYNEVWSKIRVPDYQDLDHDQAQIEVYDEDAHQLLLTQVLQPNRESVEEILHDARSNKLTRLVSTYFDHSENTTHLCLQLHRSVYRARSFYDPLHKLLDVLPVHSDSLTQPQCDSAFDVFLQFDLLDNPFPCPDSHNFHEMRRCFSQLKQQLDNRLRKSRSRVRLVRRATAGSVLCLIGSCVTVALTAAVIASHALVAIVATPICAAAYLPRKFTKKELAHVKQLDAAARGTYVLNNHLGTLDSLVSGLYAAVDCDKQLIRLGLERGKDRHSISEVMKLLHKNHLNFIHQLNVLEEHICLYFNDMNRARSLLLQEIRLYQTSNS